MIKLKGKYSLAIRHQFVGLGAGDDFPSAGNIIKVVVVAVFATMLGLFIAAYFGSLLSNNLPTATPGSLAYNVSHNNEEELRSLSNAANSIFEQLIEPLSWMYAVAARSSLNNSTVLIIVLISMIIVIIKKVKEYEFL